MDNQVYILDENELMHHGVLGMKWGIRRYQPYPSGHTGGKEIGKAAKVKSRRQVKKDIKQAKKDYRNKTGEWFTTGDNVKKVDAKKERAIQRDKKLNNYNKLRSDIQKQYQKEQKLLQTTAARKDYMQRLQADPSASSEARKMAQLEYEQAKKKSKNSINNIEKLEAFNNSTEDLYYQRRIEIAESFYKEYKDALVKDLNYSESDAELLDKYGLTKSALRWYAKRGEFYARLGN